MPAKETSILHLAKYDFQEDVFLVPNTDLLSLLGKALISAQHSHKHTVLLPKTLLCSLREHRDSLGISDEKFSNETKAS